MTTFSQLCDDISNELVRPDMLKNGSIQAYVQQTIREVHFKPGDNRPTLFTSNRYEAELAVNTDGSWLWVLPSVTRFQELESLYSRNNGLYIEPKSPRISLAYSNEPYADLFYYRSGSTYVIAGVNSGDTLLTSYFMFPQYHGYKASADRLIRYDVDTDSYVLIAGGGEPTEDQLAIETDWILQRWPDMIKEGVRAKLFKRLGDSDRARMAFSAFDNARGAMYLVDPAAY